MGETRKRAIKIRLSENEYQALQAKKGKPRLAQWLRELALEQEPARTIKAADPQLLYELNRIGVNLNQIARYCNSRQANIDLISIAAALRNIEKQIVLIRESQE